MGRFFHILSSELFFIAVLLVVLGNLIFLDVLFFQNFIKNNFTVFQTATSKEEKPAQELTSPLVTSAPLACPQTCVTLINQAVATQPAVPTVGPQLQSRATGVTHEYYIPFGTSSSTAFDWADVSGLQAYVDSTQYGTIQSVTFEASIHFPFTPQMAYVRVFNVTDKHPMWFSELSSTGGSTLLVSPPVQLDAGNKLYQIQMKTQLGAQAILDQARLHIKATY